MQYSLQIFEAKNRSKFRTIEIDGLPWFVLGDVCQQLELKTKNGSYWHHAERLDDDEKQTIDAADLRDYTSPSQGEVGRRIAPTTIIINESGLYSLILRSTRPEAKAFKKWITAEVLPALRKHGSYRVPGNGTPAFIRRYNENWERVSTGHFSVISELVIRLWGRLEQVGHLMADVAADGKELRPENSVGKLFSSWLKEKHPDVADHYGHYLHWTPQAEFPARQYSNTLLPLYIEFVDTVWIPDHSERYFRSRDPAALPYLPRLLPMAHKAKPIVLESKTPGARLYKKAS